MITVCTCPVPTALPDIIDGAPCYENFGQIQKLVFWRRGKKIASVATAEIEATWTARLASATADKAVVSPFIGGASVVPGEARTYGGGNDTKDGIPIVLGSEASTFEARILRIQQEAIAAMKTLACEELDVVFINENGQFGWSDKDGNDTFYGFPIEGLFVSDLALPGYAEPNHNIVRFMLPSGWSDTFKISEALDFSLSMTN
jgi:hypothetical protein